MTLLLGVVGATPPAGATNDPTACALLPTDAASAIAGAEIGVYTDPNPPPVPKDAVPATGLVGMCEFTGTEPGSSVTSPPFFLPMSVAVYKNSAAVWKNEVANIKGWGTGVTKGRAGGASTILAVECDDAIGAIRKGKYIVELSVVEYFGKGTCMSSQPSAYLGLIGQNL